MVTAAAWAVLSASTYMLDWPSCMPPFRIPNIAVITDPAVYLSQLMMHSASKLHPVKHSQYSGSSL